MKTPDSRGQTWSPAGVKRTMRVVPAGALALATAAVVVGLTGTGTGTGTGTSGTLDAPHVLIAASSPTPIVNCKSRSQLIPPRRHPGRIDPAVRKASTFAGPLFFYRAKNWRNQPEPLEPRKGRLAGAKLPFVLKTGRTVTVTAVPPPGRRADIAVAVDRRRPPHVVRSQRVELRSCRPSARVAGRRVGRRTPFVGGFRVDGPMCLEVEVEVAGRAEPIRRSIELGAPCQCKDEGVNI